MKKWRYTVFGMLILKRGERVNLWILKRAGEYLGLNKMIWKLRVKDWVRYEAKRLWLLGGTSNGVVWKKIKLVSRWVKKTLGSKNRVYIEKGHCELEIELLWWLVVDRWNNGRSSGKKMIQTWRNKRILFWYANSKRDEKGKFEDLERTEESLGLNKNDLRV